MNIKFFALALFFAGLQDVYCENPKNILYPQANCPEICKKTKSIPVAPLRLVIKNIKGNEYSYFWRQPLTKVLYCCKDSSITHVDQIVIPKKDEYILKSECDFVKVERDKFFVEGRGLCSVSLDSLKFIFESKDDGVLNLYGK